MGFDKGRLGGGGDVGIGKGVVMRKGKLVVVMVSREWRLLEGAEVGNVLLDRLFGVRR